MMKIALPVLLAGIIMIAGIFAMLPIDKATTVHTTIQGTQLNSMSSAILTDLSTNVTAGCGATGGDFLVYFTFTNSSTIPAPGVFTQLGVNDLATTGGTDFVVTLAIGNQTSVSGVIGGTTGETLTFFGNSTSLSAAAGTSGLEDTGDLAITVVCQSGSTPAITPDPDT